MMKITALALCLLATSSFAETIKLGVFALATEAGWGAAFQLKENGVAVITPRFDGEGTAGKPVAPSKDKDRTGTWKQTPNRIEIAYGEFRDSFKFEKACTDWAQYPCFRFEKSLTNSKKKSPWDLGSYPFINWDWKNPPLAKSPTKIKMH